MSDATESVANYVIEFNLGENGGPVRWRNAADAHQWFETELQFWNWLDSPKTHKLPRVTLLNQTRDLKNRVDAVFVGGGDPSSFRNDVE
jgi:hypothetical protein